MQHDNFRILCCSYYCFQLSPITEKTNALCVKLKFAMSTHNIIHNCCSTIVLTLGGRTLCFLLISWCSLSFLCDIHAAITDNPAVLAGMLKRVMPFTNPWMVWDSSMVRGYHKGLFYDGSRLELNVVFWQSTHGWSRQMLCQQCQNTAPRRSPTGPPPVQLQIERRKDLKKESNVIMRHKIWSCQAISKGNSASC